jgi:hypothetical protein
MITGTGSMPGSMAGSVPGSIAGSMTGSFRGSVTSLTAGSMTGSMTGSMEFNTPSKVRLGLGRAWVIDFIPQAQHFIVDFFSERNIKGTMFL